MTRRMTTQGVLVGLALVIAVAHGCGDELLLPVPVAGSGGTTTTNVGGGGAGGGVTPFRTVVVRDPLGSVDKTQNLLWDGDFEWRPSFQDQYGWLYGPSEQQISFALPPLVMGPKCRSGVKCARLDSGSVLLGLAVAFEGKPLLVSVWASPDDGKCGGLEVLLLSQSNAEGLLSVEPTSDEVDAEGWCQFSGLVPERTSAQYLYVKNTNGSVPNTGASAIVDDASIEPVDEVAMHETRWALAPSTPPAAERIAFIRRWARAAEQPRIVPPGEGEAKLRRHIRRLSRR